MLSHVQHYAMARTFGVITQEASLWRPATR